MSNLLSLDLSSALRTAVEQACHVQKQCIVKFVQAADRAVSTGSFSPASNQDTEAQRIAMRSIEDVHLS